MDGEHGNEGRGAGRRLSRWRVALLLAALFLAAVLVALPYAVGYGIRQGLKAAGADRVALEDVDLNPFTGRLVVRGLAVGDDLALDRAEVDLAWLEALRRRVVVERLEVDGFRAAIAVDESGRVTIAGLAAPPTDGSPAEATESPSEGTPTAKSSPDLPPFGVTSLRLIDCVIRYRVPDLSGEVAIDRLSLDGLYSWMRDRPADLAVEATVNGAALDVSAQLSPFAAVPAVAGKVTLDGLDLAQFAGLSAGALTELGGRAGAALTVDVAMPSPGAVRLGAAGGVSVRALRAATAEVTASLGEFDWNGGVTVATMPDAPPSVAVNGDVALAFLSATDLATGTLLAAADRVRLEGATVDVADGATRATASALRVERATVLRAAVEETPLLEMGGLAVADIALGADNRLAVGAAEVQNAWAVLARLPGGALHPLDALPKPSQTAPSATGEAPAGAPAGAPPPEAPPVTFVVERFAITGDSGVAFEDRSVAPPYALRAAIREARVEALDSGAPERRATVALKVALGDYAELNLAGTARPFADKLNLALNGEVTGLDLPPLSPYSASAIGYNVDSGALDATLKVTVTDGVIDGETVLRLRQLALAAASQDRAERMTKELTMPLDAALSILRDKRDNIKLTVPLSGSTDDPQFDLQKVINKALAGATRKAALSYLKYVLQPYGALISVAQMAAGAANAIQLDPVAFAPGDAAPPVDSSGYLEKVAGLLAEREGLNLKLCGRAVEADRLALPARQAPTVVTDPAAVADRVAAAAQGQAVPPEPATDEALLALARARAEAIKAALVERFGAAPDRVFVCNPEIDSDPDGKAVPRVELRI